MNNLQCSLENDVFGGREEFLAGEGYFVVGQETTAVGEAGRDVGGGDGFDERQLVLDVAVGQEEAGELQGGHVVVGSCRLASDGLGSSVVWPLMGQRREEALLGLSNPMASAIMMIVCFISDNCFEVCSSL